MAEDKKIIIDEDWKSQGQAEKEAAAKQTAATGASAARSHPGDMGDLEMPPASLELLLTSLATEALVAMGQVPHPATQQMVVHRNHAKYLIDTIDVLREKTKSNVTPAEQELIENLLHQLRLVYVESAHQPGPSTGAAGQS